MPKWIKIEIKDTDERPTRGHSTRSGESREGNSLLRGALLGLVLLIGVASVGFLLRHRLFGPGDVAAIVNGELITEQELAREQTLFVTMSTLTQGRPPAQIPTAYDMLNQVIADRLKYQVATSAGTAVSSAEVEAQISALEAEAGFTEAQLQSALEQAGLDRRVLEEWLRRQMAITRYVNSVVLLNVPPAAQEAALRNWSNTLQLQANVEIRLGASGMRQAARINQPAPDFALPTPDGETIRLSDLRGRPVLLNFWATWCPPCKIEMPDIEAVYQKYKDQGFTVIAIDQQESPAQVRQFFEAMNLSFQPVIDSTGEIFNLYRVVALPTSYFIDAQGIVRVQHRGMMTREQMEAYISQIIPQ